jgi:dTDP-N-acetylfucosamine:lipid II N-acetylfucosaminyltransferase
MNLHIVPDSKFTETFYSNLVKLGLDTKNRLIIRSNNSSSVFVKHTIPVAALYSTKFDNECGDTRQYKEVFIHQFSPLMYRWVAQNKFNKLNWCVWGADIYNLPGFDKLFYEPETWQGYSKNSFWKSELLYRIKLYATNMVYQRKAYSKVNGILTWMKSEFDFISEKLPVENAQHKFFFYQNEVPYEKLDQVVGEGRPHRLLEKQIPLLIVGNSGTDTNNHIDAVRKIASSGLAADLLIPLSYGQKDYIRFVKKNLDFYKNGEIKFLEDFMGFEDYVRLISNSDGLVMNHKRPQGYGNIFMMMYLKKPVFLNPANISVPDLDRFQLKWHSLNNIGGYDFRQADKNQDNTNALKDLFADEKLEQAYGALFS